MVHFLLPVEENSMLQNQPIRLPLAGLLFALALTSLTSTLFAQTTKLRGVIKGRSGASLILQTSDSPNVSVLLTDNTAVSQIKGVLKARRESMSMAALIPGLA